MNSYSNKKTEIIQRCPEIAKARHNYCVDEPYGVWLLLRGNSGY
jgi:hypothetical protein